MVQNKGFGWRRLIPKSVFQELHLLSRQLDTFGSSGEMRSDALASVWWVYERAKVNFFLLEISLWNCLPDAVDGKGSLGVSFTFLLPRDCVRTACCSAARFGLSCRKKSLFPSVQ